MTIFDVTRLQGWELLLERINGLFYRNKQITRGHHVRCKRNLNIISGLGNKMPRLLSSKQIVERISVIQMTSSEKGKINSKLIKLTFVYLDNVSAYWIILRLLYIIISSLFADLFNWSESDSVTKYNLIRKIPQADTCRISGGQQDLQYRLLYINCQYV